jgi:hypothetical protein
MSSTRKRTKPWKKDKAGLDSKENQALEERQGKREPGIGRKTRHGTMGVLQQEAKKQRSNKQYK